MFYYLNIHLKTNYNIQFVCSAIYTEQSKRKMEVEGEEEKLHEVSKSHQHATPLPPSLPAPLLADKLVQSFVATEPVFRENVVHIAQAYDSIVASKMIMMGMPTAEREEEMKLVFPKLKGLLATACDDMMKIVNYLQSRSVFIKPPSEDVGSYEVVYLPAEKR